MRRKAKNKRRRKSVRGMSSRYSLNGKRMKRAMQTAQNQRRTLRRAAKGGGV